MKTVQLGKQGLKVSRMGLGCMGMSDFYGSRDEAESLRTLDRALALGISFWDTADMYGPFTNEILVGKALHGRRDQVTLATKFGIVRNESGERLGIDGSPSYVRRCIDASLKRLRVDEIDLYYLHRVDPRTPIEETVGAMAELVKEGKVRYLGLSEVSVETLKKAHRVHPITAVQSEYSLWTRDPENGLIATMRELGIGFVAYSPLGRGFLTGAIRSPEDMAPGDFRHFNPRFMGENFPKNLALVKQIEILAAERGVTPSQIALAWVMAQGEDIVPIPGTKHVRYLEENAASTEITLSSRELNRIEEVFPMAAAAGDRYPDMSAVNR